MDRESFKILKRSQKGPINEEELKRIKMLDNINPVMRESAELLLRNVNYNEDFTNLIQTYSVIDDSKSYKDQLVVTYLVFLGRLVNLIQLQRIFVMPQSFAIFDWLSLYKRIAFSIISLLYNKKFTNTELFLLDDMVNEINEGHADAVRKFMSKIKILTMPNKPTEIEKKFSEAFFMSADKYGPFYWRILHFMAEAIDLRENHDLAKEIWRNFTLNSLHRTHACTFCKKHYEKIIEEFRNDLQNINISYANVWFNIHNYINKYLNKAIYSETEFKKDQSVMRNLLSLKL